MPELSLNQTHEKTSKKWNMEDNTMWHWHHFQINAQ